MPARVQHESLPRRAGLQLAQQRGQQQARLAPRQPPAAAAIDAYPGRGQPGGVGHLGQERGGIHCLGLQRLPARGRQQALQQFTHLRDPALQPLQARRRGRIGAGVVEQHFGHALDHRQRRAQGVAGISEEGLLAGVRGDQPRLVGVDRARQPPEIVAAGGLRQRGRGRLVGQGVDRLRQPVQRRQRQPGEPPAQRAGEQGPEHHHRRHIAVQVALQGLDVAEVDGEHQPPGGGVEHADVDVRLRRILAHPGREAGVGRRQRGVTLAVAAQALGARQPRALPGGQQQAVVVGLPAQDLGRHQVFVVLRQPGRGAGGQQAQQQAEGGRHQGGAQPQRQRAPRGRAHAGGTRR
nr:hypothetical protein [Thermomonas flagellata]